MDIQFYNEEFPYTIIKELYTEEQEERIWKELDEYQSKLKYPSEVGSASAWDNEVLKVNKGIWIDDILKTKGISTILQVTNEVFQDKLRAMILDHPHWFFSTTAITKENALISYYEDGDYYKPHYDNCRLTILNWMYRKPKRFTGGELVFTDYNKTIELESNKAIIFPGTIRHAVNRLSMDKKYKGMGRWCITHFLILH